MSTCRTPQIHSSLSSVHDDSSKYCQSPQVANHQKRTWKSSSNANVNAHVVIFLLLQFPHWERIKGNSCFLLGIIVKTVEPDKFVHKQCLGISEQISNAMGKEEHVGTSFISSLTAAHNNAVAKFEDAYGETDLDMKETLYILPPETSGTNEYFNGGMSSFFIYLFYICKLALHCLLHSSSLANCRTHKN